MSASKSGPGKKFPITEAHSAAIELHDALAEAVTYYDEEVAGHPREIALSVMLVDLMRQALQIQSALGNLARAEK